MMDINVELLQWLINVLIKKTSGETLKNEIISNKELTQELHKPIIRKFEKQKVHSSFIDNICGADLADMQLISKFNEGFKFLLCVFDIYSKYPWVVTRIKKALQLLMLFKKLQMNLIAKQIKYGYVKAVKFIIDQ